MIECIVAGIFAVQLHEFEVNRHMGIFEYLPHMGQHLWTYSISRQLQHQN